MLTKITLKISKADSNYSTEISVLTFRIVLQMFAYKDKFCASKNSNIIAESIQHKLNV